MTSYKCNFCPECTGNGCVGQLPGMGGVRGSENFRLNVAGWEKVRREHREKVAQFLSRPVEFRVPHIAIAPITGAVENIGYKDEESYYTDIIEASHNVGIELCIGDGYPDEKLRFGISAVRRIQEKDPRARISVFIKPYPNPRILERIDWAEPYVDTIGIDIDSYNIVTMRSLVNLEKKTPELLLEIKEKLASLGLPFAIKGIFTEDDVALVRAVRPEIAYISNHGGRVDTRTGSTADFLVRHGAELRAHCRELWVDGGVRTPLDIATAMALGADRVLIGRPFVTALCRGGERALCEKVLALSLMQYAWEGHGN